ncbi:MAG: hypothetical protein IT244_04210 [Bacteroidia bacterium]|nr:hypothetical protein [Bacteroidia bacterium]
MNLKNTYLNIPTLVFFFLTLFASCNNGAYLQEYQNYQDFDKIKNRRLTGWFPDSLQKQDAYYIKNISYLSTTCVFGVFNYQYEELYDTIFHKENFIDHTQIKTFKTQIELVKNIIPVWFPPLEYWNEKQNGIILYDNNYAYKDSIKKQIYYFQPELRFP